ASKNTSEDFHHDFFGGSAATSPFSGGRFKDNDSLRRSPSFWGLKFYVPFSSPRYIFSRASDKTRQGRMAYANRHAFSYVPPAVKKLRNERKVLNHLENKGVIKSVEPYVCRVCGRKFNTNDKLMGHFTIQEREHQKRVNQIQSAKGKKRRNLVGRYAMKMEKYRNACKDVVTPKVGYGLADELKRAGFWVRTVSDKPQAADVALRNCMVDLMDRRAIQCLVLVSDDSDFVGVLKEARERCVKTVVVGGNDDGVLKRSADACFSWRDIIVGKARSEAGSVVGRWRDRDILKRLEWTYDPEVEKGADKLSDSSDFEDAECGDSTGKDDSRLVGKDDKPWWELDSDAEGSAKPYLGYCFCRFCFAPDVELGFSEEIAEEDGSRSHGAYSLIHRWGVGSCVWVVLLVVKVGWRKWAMMHYNENDLF
ncbi:hypothetical protein KSS87_021546, partial [Heliosperma pusillum]